MNSFRKTAFCALSVLLVSATASAFNSFEKAAQKNMDNYLKNQQNYETKIIEKDQSLNFMVGENIFWITFEGDADGMLYTLHRRPIRLEDKNISESELNMRKEKALRAIAALNSTKPYKAVLRDNQVDFEFPVFAAGSAEYEKVFPTVLKTLNTVSLDMFREEMNKVKLDNGSDAFTNNDAAPIAAVIVVEQPSTGNGTPKNTGKVTMSNPMFRSLDKKGNVLVPYGDVLYQDNIQFIQASVEASADKAEAYDLSIRIVNPEGKTFVPAKDASMTVSQSFDITKKEKTLTFPPFGSDNNIIWQPGKYTFVFFVNGVETMRRTVNIL